MLPLIWTPRAQSDLLEIIRYIGKVNPGAAERMKTRLETVVLPLSEHLPTLRIQQRSCHPVVKTVSLPSVDAAQLPSVGDSGPATNFTLTLRCPHNAAWYGYYVESVHGYEDEAQGVIKIAPASTAKGIGLQLTSRHYAHPIYPSTGNRYGPTYVPIKFGPTNRYGSALNTYTWPMVTGDPLTDESDYSFPYLSPGEGGMGSIKVAVYRTGTIVPGAYTAALTLYVVYR